MHLVGGLPGHVRHLEERPVTQCEPALARRTPAADKILVGKVRMKLYGTQAVGVALSHQGIGQPPGQPGFPRAGRPLQDQVFLVAPAGKHHLQFFPRNKAPLLQDALHVIAAGRIRRRHGGDGRLRIRNYRGRFLSGDRLRPVISGK